MIKNIFFAVMITTFLQFCLANTASALPVERSFPTMDQGFAATSHQANRAIQAPKQMAFYYGWPSAINGAGGDVTSAAAAFGQFDIVVLGKGIQDAAHGDHENVTAIIAQLATQPGGHPVEVFGYVDMGVTTDNLSLTTAQQSVDEWLAMGVDGIFWNNADYAAGVDRTRQNALIDYTHSQSLAVMISAWNPDDLFADDPDPTHLGANDIYLATGWLTGSAGYLSLTDWIARVDKMRVYRTQTNTRMAGLSTGDVDGDLGWPSHTYQMALNGALIAELDILAYTNDHYSASGDHVNQIIVPPVPTEGLGVAFTDSDIIHLQNNIHTRRTTQGEFGIGGDGTSWGLGYYRPFIDPLYTSIYYGADGWNVPNLQALESWTGKKNSVVVLFTPLSKPFPLEAMENLWANGNTPLITLEPWDHSAAQLAAGEADAELMQWGEDFNKWLDSCGGRSAFFRFAHEMNRGWYPWGNDAPNYVATWQNLHTMFSNLGIDDSEVQWVWNPVNDAGGSTVLAEAYYPGDAYVDWMALDGYNWGQSQPNATWDSYRTFPDIFDSMLARLHALNPDKPILIAETGTTGVSDTTFVNGIEQGAGDPAIKSQWLANTFMLGTKAYRQLKLAAYFNVDKGSPITLAHETDWAVFNNGSADNPLDIPADEFDDNKRFPIYADAMENDLYIYEFPLDSVFGQRVITPTNVVTPTFGVVMHPTWNRDKDQARMDKAASLGANVLRLGLSWRLLEPAEGVQDNNWYVPAVDNLLADAEARNLEVIFMLAGAPCWASADPDKDCSATPSHKGWYPPTDPADYGNAFAFLVQRYGDRIKAWEVWNEPNVTEFWGDSTPDAATYTAMLQAAYTAIKAVDSDAVVLAGSLAGTDSDYLDQMYTAGAKGHFDALALHPYTSGAPSHCGNARWGYERGVEDIRDLMLAQGDDLPIWFTEFGWSSYDGDGGVGEANQAAYLAEALQIARHWDYVPVATWYNLVDRTDIFPNSRLGYFGLFDLPDLNPKFAATTFRELITATVDTTVRYTNSSDNYPNPERGFYKHTSTHTPNYTLLTASLLQGYYDDNNTLILRFFYLEDFVNAPISQSYLDNMQADFDTLRGSGLKAVIRFAYTDVGKDPPYGDATKAQVLAHIAQLAPLLQTNGDVIATVQAGFIGTWGEWHYTDHFVTDPANPGNVTAADYADRQEIVDALLNALPASIQVQVRTPADKQNMYGDGSTGASAALSESQAHDGSNIARVAHHNDCFLASSTDYGTYGDVTQDQAYLELENRYLVMGGETCNPNPPRSECATALDELERFHWTYLNDVYHPDVLDSWIADGCMTEIQQRLGYRLALQQALYSDAVRPGDGFTVHMELQNQGFAAPIKPRPVELLLRHATSGDIYQVTLPADPRGWLPAHDVSNNHLLDYTICTPADMPLGDYAMLLHLPDSAEALADQPAYAIQLANSGIWESNTGYNDLLHTITLDDSAPSMACDSSLIVRKEGDLETKLYVSASTGGRIGGVRFRDEDILLIDRESGDVEMVFDGSDVGARADLNAFHMMDDGTILMSFNRPVALDGLTVDDSDIVRFSPTQLGTATLGTFSLYFDGSDVGLISSGEDIDAIALTSDGRLMVSTLGSFRRNPAADGSYLSGKDEDIFIFNGSSLGENTAGTWEHYFDGSDVALINRSEDVWGIAIDPDGNDLLLTTRGVFTAIDGFSGDGADIFGCTLTQSGNTTACGFSTHWDGSQQGFGAKKLDGFSLSSSASFPIVKDARAGDVAEDEDAEELLDDDVADESNYLPFIVK